MILISTPPSCKTRIKFETAPIYTKKVLEQNNASIYNHMSMIERLGSGQGELHVVICARAFVPEVNDRTSNLRSPHAMYRFILLIALLKRLLYIDCPKTSPRPRPNFDKPHLVSTSNSPVRACTDRQGCSAPFDTCLPVLYNIHTYLQSLLSLKRDAARASRGQSSIYV